MIGAVFYPLSRVITAISVFFAVLFGGGGLAAAFSTPVNDYCEIVGKRLAFLLPLC